MKNIFGNYWIFRSNRGITFKIAEISVIFFFGSLITAGEKKYNCLLDNDLYGILV